MQTNKLKALFTMIKEEGKAVRFGDLMRAGFNQHLILAVVKDTGAALQSDQEGYTIITF